MEKDCYKGTTIRPIYKIEEEGEKHFTLEIQRNLRYISPTFSRGGESIFDRVTRLIDEASLKSRRWDRWWDSSGSASPMRREMRFTRFHELDDLSKISSLFIDICVYFYKCDKNRCRRNDVCIKLFALSWFPSKGGGGKTEGKYRCE